ncbi:MAG: phenylacetate--CoA ligase family protein [Gemmatimonadales bacterium]
MSSPLLKLYHRLPSRMRSAAATLRGWYLNRWRYGSGSRELFAEALERDHWSPAQWDTWRQERIAYILHRAATRVPYYRAYWQQRRRQGDGASWEVLEHWPLLEKDAVRAHPEAFLADDCDRHRMFREETSGTTGTPLKIWRSRATLATLHAVADARTRGWDGIPDDARWARLGGQLVTPVRRRRPPFWVWNAAMRQLYLSAYHLAPDLIPYYLDALARYRVVYLGGYPSAIQTIAYEAVRLKRRDLRMAAVYANAEPVLPEQRQLVAEAFGCPIRETYGMAESVAAASECDAGRLHEWPEFGYVELQPDGELVCTGLLNPDMILIRYRVGDRGWPADAALAPCLCGRGLPLMGPIEGRTDDVLITPDGRQAPRMGAVFHGLPVRQSQIVQEELDVVRVRVAPGDGFTRAHERTIAARVRERLGRAVRVLVEPMDELPRTSSGKLRAIVSHLSPDERAAALGRTA